MDQHDRTDEDVPCVAGVNGRLNEAETDREPLELIFSVRGTVCRVVGRHPGRWRVRTSEGHVVTFRPGFDAGHGVVDPPSRSFTISSTPTSAVG